MNKRRLGFAALLCAAAVAALLFAPWPTNYPKDDPGWQARWVAATAEIGRTPGEGWAVWANAREQLGAAGGGPTIVAMDAAMPRSGWPDRITPPEPVPAEPPPGWSAAFERLALGIRVAAAAEDAERVLELARLARRLESGLAAEDGLDGLVRGFVGGAEVDRALQEAVAAGLFSDDPGAVAELIALCEDTGGGELALRLERERSLRRAVEAGVAVRRARRIDQFFYEVDLGWRGRSDAARRAEEMASRAAKDGIGSYLPDLDALKAARRAARAERVGLRVMLALEHHRARNGVYPETLAGLTPHEFIGVPVDPFGFGERFGYRLVDPAGGSPGEAYLLYSVGPDRVDDLGTPVDDAGRGDRVFSPGPTDPGEEPAPMTRPMTTRSARLFTAGHALVCSAVLGVLAGCESGVGAVRPAPGVEVVEGADPAMVDLLAEPPERAFRLVGRVRASADARFEARIGEARAAAERELREQGASVGADAVIVDEAFVLDLDGAAIEDPVPVLDDDRNRQRPGGAAYATRPVHRVVLVGRAIRWTPAPVPPVSE